eukprot:6214596-Pleurochrysis_carterae.AAC.6
MINGEEDAMNARKPHPTLYSGEVVDRTEADEETSLRGRNMARLTERARNNKHKQERKGETYGEKKTKLAKGGKDRGWYQKSQYEKKGKGNESYTQGGKI